MKGMAAMAFGLVVAGCSKDAIFSQEEMTEEFGSNFEANILNGKEVDANQTWSTASSVPVQVTVDLDYGEEYMVYIYPTAPLLDEDAAYIGAVKVKSGETTTINVTRPSDVVMLYAACYDKDNHAVGKCFGVRYKGTKVEFSNKEKETASQVAHRAASTGNRWSVTPQNMPDLTTYTTGTLYEMEEAFNTNGSTEVNQADGSEKHLKITDSYSGSIARLQSYDNQSVYVTGTWTVPADQRVTGGSVVVVGNGGKIVIPEGHLLSTNANNEAGTTGMIYVMPGGTIEGAGQLQFSNGTQTFSYNGGTITVSNININGGTLYNAGTIGKSTNTTTALEGPGGTPENPSLFINLGQAYFTQTSGAGLAVHNACNMYVTGKMALGNSSKMDDGSYIECGSLELNGSNNGGIVLYMGNAAYMNCKGDFSVNNFGVWGPAGRSYQANAIFRINDCTYVNTTEDTAVAGSTYMLDHVELIVPSGWTTTEALGGTGADIIAQGGGWLQQGHPHYRQAQLIYQYFNGQECHGINPDNWEWVEIQAQGHQIDYEPWWVVDEPGFQGNVLKEDGVQLYANGVGEDRATCAWGTTPSLTVVKDERENCGVDIKKGSNPLPQPNYYYYAFEDLGTTNDIDFNDVVIRVSTPDANGKSDVYLMAAGGTMPTSVIYGTGENPRVLCKEVHSALGVASVKTMVNTGCDDGEDKEIVKIGTIEDLSSTTDMANLPFGIIASGNGGTVRVQRSIQDYGKVPLMIVVSGYTSGSNAGKWFWPTERTNISTAYTQFGAWGANVQSNPTWYQNYTDGTVYTW